MPGRSVAYIFTGNFTNLTAGLAVASRNVTELGTKMTALDKNGTKMRAGLTTLGGAAGKVGVVAAAGLGVAILASARFDQAMSKVQAATHETADNMEKLRAAAIKAGADTKYSASEAAEGIEALAKAGVSTKNILGGGLTGALNLAAAGGQSVADAAETAATTLTQFKLAGDQTSHVADVLAAAAGKAQGEVSDMAAALKYVGPVAAQMGVSLEQTTGTIAELASQGIIGEQAGTSLRGMLTSLTSPSKQAADQMDALGISLYDAQGKFVGLDGIAGELQASMGNLTAAERDQALGRIFGNEQITAARILYAGGAGDVQKWTKAVDDQGYAAETAAIKMDNLAGDFEQFKGSLETALIGAGDGSQGPLRGLVQDATQAVNALNAIPGPAKNVASAFLGITAVTGGSLWFGSKVINGIASAREALSALGITAETTRSKLALVGSGGAAAALGVGTLVDTLSQMDSLSRSSATADATVKSFQDLSDALQYSNVGKYADDLHINLGRLTQDLADNGAQGEYAQRILEQLGDSSHGFGALLKSEAGSALPFYTDSASKAYDANKDLKTLIDEMPSSLSDQTAATVPATTAVSDYGVSARTSAQATADLNDEIRKSREDARKQAQAFIGLGDSLDDTKVSLNEWLKDLQKQADALRDFRVNAETAAKKGLRQGLIAALEDAGPAGALRMKQLAGATKEQIGQANKAWQSGQREIQKYTAAVGGVPTSTGTTVQAKTFDAMAAIARLKVALAQVHSKDVEVRVHYMNIGNKLAGMAAGRAGGGPIYGPGTKTSDSVPIRASRGEFMMSAAAVDHYGLDTMFSLNARRLAGGGDVNGRPPEFGSITQAARPKTIGAATAEIVALRQTIKSLNLDIRESDKTIKRETRARDRLSKTVDRNQAEVDRITGLYDSLSTAIQSNLAANQFAPTDPWKTAGGIAGILDSLNTSTANANAMTAATGTLSASLTGAALQSVLEQGLQTTQMFAGLSAADLAKYQADFDTNATALAQAGNVGATARYGQEQAKANAILAASQAELARQSAELRTQTHQNAVAEKQRDRAEKDLKQVKDILGELRDEAKKLRGDATSGARSRT